MRKLIKILSIILITVLCFSGCEDEAVNNESVNTEVSSVSSETSETEVRKPEKNSQNTISSAESKTESSVISWTSRGGSAEYNEAVAEVKRAWLAKHLPSVSFTAIHIIPYGTPKSTCGRGILFDDEQRNLDEWGEGAHAASEIFEILRGL